MDYDKAIAHVGHNIEIANYGNGANISVECMDCNEVVVDVDRDDAGMEE